MEDNNRYVHSAIVDLNNIFVPQVYEAYVDFSLIEELNLTNEPPQKIKDTCDEIIVQTLKEALGEDIFCSDVILKRVDDKIGVYSFGLTERALSEVNMAADNCYLPDLMSRLEYIIWTYRDF